MTIRFIPCFLLITLLLLSGCGILDSIFDSDSQCPYFPMHVGDTWNYIRIAESDTQRKSIKILKKIKENGNEYYFMDQWIDIGGWYDSGFIRLQTNHGELGVNGGLQSGMGSAILRIKRALQEIFPTVLVSYLIFLAKYILLNILLPMWDASRLIVSVGLASFPGNLRVQLLMVKKFLQVKISFLYLPYPSI